MLWLLSLGAMLPTQGPQGDTAPSRLTWRGARQPVRTGHSEGRREHHLLSIALGWPASPTAGRVGWLEPRNCLAPALPDLCSVMPLPPCWEGDLRPSDREEAAGLACHTNPPVNGGPLAAWLGAPAPCQELWGLWDIPVWRQYIDDATQLGDPGPFTVPALESCWQPPEASRTGLLPSCKALCPGCPPLAHWFPSTI